MARTTSQLPPEVLSALQAGRKVEAIQLLRQATGLGLAEAKQMIDAHARGLPFSAPNIAGTARPVSLPPEVVQALEAGNKIEAIRLLRASTGMGLKDAKDAVDAASVAGLAPGEMPGRSSTAVWWIVGAVVLAAIYMLAR